MGAEATPETFVAEVVRAARTVLSATGESLPSLAQRLSVPYSSLWRILHGRNVRLSTLRVLHRRLVEENAAPPDRPQHQIRFLGTVSYLRAAGALTAPYLEVRDLGALTLLLGGPSSGKTTTLLLAAAAADPLGPWVRVAARVFGLSLADVVLGLRAELVVVGPAGQMRSSWVRTGSMDPLRVEAAARSAGVSRRAVVGSLQLPAEGAPSLVAYVGFASGSGEVPSDSRAAAALRAAGVRVGDRIGSSGRLVAAAAAALLAACERPGLVLVEAGIPPSSLPALLEIAAEATDRGAQVLWASADPKAAEPFETSGGRVLSLRRGRAGAVRGVAGRSRGD